MKRHFFTILLTLPAYFMTFGQSCVVPGDCNDGNACTSDQCVNGFCTYVLLQVNISGQNPTACGLCDGSAAANVLGGTSPYSYQWSSGSTNSSVGTGQQSGTKLCINAGGNQFIASTGDTFKADQYFSGGTTFSSVVPIANTTDDVLYQSERWVGNSGFFSYNIPVINGNYNVELHFAEVFFNAAGSRVFDVSIEGIVVLDDYDIYADAGGNAIAKIKSINTAVSDGTLNILFDGIVNNAKINAICVKPQSADPGLCPGVYSLTVTDANDCVVSDTITIAPVICDDENDCTTDSCVNGTCVFTLIVCDDGDPCTTDKCVRGGCVYNPMPCDDGNSCTTDTCIGGTCQYNSLPDCCSSNAACADNDPCTNDTCISGTCANIYIVCDDGNSCTIDNCVDGICVSTNDPLCCNNGAGCDDGNACTNDICVAGICTFEDIDCDDNNPCTDDFCNESCQHIFTGCCISNSDCNDNDACTTDECNAGLCLNQPINCDDGDPCTADSCTAGTCYHGDPLSVSLGPDQTIYRGYPPLKCAILEAQVSGTPPFTYAWSTGSSSFTIKACPIEETTYCVTVTDANGCTAEDCLEVCVQDVRCGSLSKTGVLVCHKPGTPAQKTLCVNWNAASGHFSHGDILGDCRIQPCQPFTLKTLLIEEEEIEVMMPDATFIQAYPNPFSNLLNIEFMIGYDSPVKVELFELSGKLISTLFDGTVNSSELKLLNYSATELTPGIMIYRIQTEAETFYGKVTLVR